MALMATVYHGCNSNTNNTEWDRLTRLALPKSLPYNTEAPLWLTAPGGTIIFGSEAQGLAQTRAVKFQPFAVQLPGTIPYNDGTEYSIPRNCQKEKRQKGKLQVPEVWFETEEPTSIAIS